jgi:serine/alanine adding enzyme
VEVEPDRWDDLLAKVGCTDVYFQCAYVESALVLEPGAAAYLHVEGDRGDVVLPCIVRTLPEQLVGAEGLLDVITPYGYGGPVATGDDPPLERFWELYGDWCVERRVIASFMRFHPLLENHRHAGPGFAVERLGTTIAWRLEPAIDPFDGMHSAHRNSARKAQRAGAEVSAVECPADLREFVEAYEATMTRAGASPFYFFDHAYWRRLERSLRDRLVRFDARIEGELVSSALCLAALPWMHYHFGATSELGRSSGAGNLVLVEAARWAQARGFELFHLGGGVGGGEDPLFRFKERFYEDGRNDAYVGKAVHDESAYAALTGRGAGDLSGFFPAYRGQTQPT